MKGQDKRFRHQHVSNPLIWMLDGRAKTKASGKLAGGFELKEYLLLVARAAVATTATTAAIFAGLGFIDV